MKKIKNGTYRAMRMDGSGYVYGTHRIESNVNFIKARGQDNWLTPIKIETLVYRFNGKWIKSLFQQNKNSVQQSVNDNTKSGVYNEKVEQETEEVDSGMDRGKLVGRLEYLLD